MTPAYVGAHPAREVVIEGPDGSRRRECSTCGRPTRGFPGGVRHVGEARPFETVDPRYAEAVTAASDIVHRTGGLDPDKAHAVAVALARAGWLRQRRQAP